MIPAARIDGIIVPEHRWIGRWRRRGIFVGHRSRRRTHGECGERSRGAYNRVRAQLAAERKYCSEPKANHFHMILFLAWKYDSAELSDAVTKESGP